ncbi:hypothetical protein DL764_008094 [Monosporascus ibericus]|uniref:Uncharacterized protein n=1 Tax=Monosporascus ibericus TaxID=155417 RepID=A0A4Q4T0I9_9PEZI|nr:hypothetical protein DL764_008094 [Monosporascus ibericus]
MPNGNRSITIMTTTARGPRRLTYGYRYGPPAAPRLRALPLPCRRGAVPNPQRGGWETRRALEVGPAEGHEGRRDEGRARRREEEETGDEYPDVPRGKDFELYREFFNGVTSAREECGASEKLGTFIHPLSRQPPVIENPLLRLPNTPESILLSPGEDGPRYRPVRHDSAAGAGMKASSVGLDGNRITGRLAGDSPSTEQQSSHTNYDPRIHEAQQQCQTTDTPSASSRVHLRGGSLSESGDQEFVYYSGTSAPHPAPPVARPTRAELPPSYRRRETAGPPPFIKRQVGRRHTRARGE